MEQALDRVRNHYVLVGLNEELELTLSVLEKALPRFFGGVQAASPKTAAHVTSRTNKLTNTSMNGCISSRARSQIAERASNYPAEVQFYNEVKRLFWHRVVAYGLR